MKFLVVTATLFYSTTLFAAAPGSLSVVSLNLAQETDTARILADIDAAPRVRNADVLLLQEVANPGGGVSVAETIATVLGWHAVFRPMSRDIDFQGLAILSRYPLSNTTVTRLEEHNTWWHRRKRFAISALVDLPGGGVRVWNVHLDNRINHSERMEQLAPVLEEARAHNGPRLIGGDFNTNDFFWLANVLPVPTPGSHIRALRGLMERFGFATPLADALVTLPLAGRHLDWIFADSGFHPGEWGVERVAFSDHRAVWAEFTPVAMLAAGAAASSPQ